MNPECLLHLAEFSIAPSLEGVSAQRLIHVISLYGVLVSLGLVVVSLFVFRLPGERTRWEAYSRRLLARPWPLRSSLVVAGFTLGVFAFAMACLAAINALSEGMLEERPTLALSLQSLLLHLPVLVFLAVYLAKRGIGWREAFGIGERTWRADLWTGILFYLGALPIIGLSSWLYQIGLESVGYEAELQDVALLITDDASLLVRIQLVAMSVFLAPIFEEFVFRGIALPVLARRFGPVTAVIIISAGFAAIHQHIPSLVALFLFAVALSYAYIRTGSLRVPMVMHACFNVVNLGLLLYLRMDT